MSRWLRGEPQALPFDEVWRDLAAELRRQVTLHSLNGGETFIAHAVTHGQAGIVLSGVRFDSAVRDTSAAEDQEVRTLGPNEVLIPKSCLADLWQNIRGYGFCTVGVMPPSLAGLADYVMAALATLAYLVPIGISTPQERATGIERGLRLHTPATKPSHAQRSSLQPVSSVCP